VRRKKRNYNQIKRENIFMYEKLTNILNKGTDISSLEHAEHAQIVKHKMDRISKNISFGDTGSS